MGFLTWVCDKILQSRKDEQARADKQRDLDREREAGQRKLDAELNYEMRTGNINIRKVEQLVHEGADPNAKYTDDLTAWEYAEKRISNDRKRGESIKIFENAGHRRK